MSDVIEFRLPYPLKSLNIRDRQHWAKRRREKAAMRLEILAAIGGPAHILRPPWQSVRVAVTRHSVGSLDPDNLYAACKPLLDCLGAATGIGLFLDDRANFLTLEVTQASAKRCQGYTTVTVTRVS